MSTHQSDDSGHAPKIPAPAHPQTRRAPLPWQQPKAAEEDPDAPRRIAAILQSPSYREAENDVDFLHRDELRGLRLHLEFLKPELLLAEHQIQHTIVVLGSTRILEPDAARRTSPEARRQAIRTGRRLRTRASSE